MLWNQDIRVTQATVSRDLSAIGAVKTPQGYQLADRLSSGGVESEADLARTLAAHSLDIVPASSIVVVRTGPGHAGVVGDALDSAHLEEIVGVVAGDDTVFIAAHSSSVASKLAKHLNALASGFPA